MDMTLEITSMVSFINAFLVLIAFGSVESTNSSFERKSGYLLTGTPFERIFGLELNYCIVACSDSSECRFMNVFREETIEFTLCELFNFSAMVNTTKLVPSPNSAFYKLIIFKDCLEIKSSSKTEASAIYPIVLPKTYPNEAFCDMKTNGGGWTLLQRRFDGSVNFDLNWQSYKIGFGSLKSEFWFGLEKTHFLMQDSKITLRVDLWYGQAYYFMEYYNATLANEINNYRLSWTSSSGNATDNMHHHKEMNFSTKDRDNDPMDENCALDYSGGWWYHECIMVNLNGVHGSTGFAKGIIWYSLTGYHTSLSKTEIKIKRNTT